MCWQGGTCVIVGDEHARVTEAAKAAERHLRCKVLRTSPFWSKEGFSQETYNEQVQASTMKAQAQVQACRPGKTGTEGASR